MTSDDLRKILASRAKKCIALSGDLLLTGEYIIAGSCIATNQIRDIDVFPVWLKEFSIPKDNIITESPNATTISNDNGPVIQFCKYEWNSLENLLKSFDFAHLQAGVKISDGFVQEIKWTDEFLYAHAASTSSFTGSEYPLSSLLRLLKYHKRDEISEQSAMVAVLDIILAVISRGFNGWEDFKRQLDAIDLNLIPEQQEELDIDNLRRLFDVLNKGQ